jgi:hypothetical protein
MEHSAVIMTPTELENHLSFLELSQTEAARLLSVAPRTVRRWLGGEQIPGPVEQAFRAWHRLRERNLAWRPDSIAIVDDDQQQIAAHRAHAIAVAEMIARVEARGGPRLPWLVDRERSRAILGPIEVSFYRLANGGFSIASYTRNDGNPDVDRDREFIEDAAYSIAKEMRKEAAIPVTLVYTDAPLFYGPYDRIGTLQTEEFPSNDAAIQRACALMQGPNFHGPFIREGKIGDVLWYEPELRRECERRMKASS